MNPLIIATILLSQADVWSPIRQSQATQVAQAPPATPDQPHELTYAEAYKRSQAGETMVVLIGADWCQGCRELWSQLQDHKHKFVLVHVDRDSDDGKNLLLPMGGNPIIPQVRIFARGKADNAIPRKVRVRRLGVDKFEWQAPTVDEVLRKVGAVEQSARQPPARKPIGSASDGGGAPNALARLRSLPQPNLAIVDPPTWQAYYDHVTLDHGVRADMAKPLDIAALRLVHSHAHDRTLPAEWYR